MEPTPTERHAAPPMFRNVMAVVSLVVGSLGILAIGVYPAFGLLFGVVGGTLGVLGLRRSRTGAPGRGIAIAGIVVSSLSIVVIAVAALLISIDFPAM